MLYDWRTAYKGEDEHPSRIKLDCMELDFNLTMKVAFIFVEFILSMPDVTLMVNEFVLRLLPKKRGLQV